MRSIIALGVIVLLAISMIGCAEEQPEMPLPAIDDAVSGADDVDADIEEDDYSDMEPTADDLEEDEEVILPIPVPESTVDDQEDNTETTEKDLTADQDKELNDIIAKALAALDSAEADLEEEDDMDETADDLEGE